MLPLIRIQMTILCKPLKLMDNEPILPPKNGDASHAHVFQVRLKINGLIRYRSLSSLHKVFERLNIRRAGMLSYGLIKKFNYLLELKLANIFQVGLSRQRKQLLSLLNVVHRLFGYFRIRLIGGG